MLVPGKLYRFTKSHQKHLGNKFAYFQWPSDRDLKPLNLDRDLKVPVDVIFMYVGLDDGDATLEKKRWLDDGDATLEKKRWRRGIFLIMGETVTTSIDTDEGAVSLVFERLI